MSSGNRDVTVDDPPPGDRAPGQEPTGAALGRWGRIGSAAVGGTLLALGIRRRSLGGAATALAGGWLVYRGLAGNSSLDRARGSQAATDDPNRRPNPT